MYAKILVPLDTSPFSEQALTRAVAIARATMAQLHLVLVHSPPAYPVDGGALVGLGLLEQERAYFDGFMQGAAADLERRHGLKVHTALLDGPVVESISAYAREQGMDLIVLATHGRTGLSRAWLGSVADGVVRHATMPVLMVRPKEHAPGQTHEGDGDLFKRVLVALDGSETAERIIEHAYALGASAGATYFLVRVVPPVPLPVPNYGVPNLVAAIVPDPEATEHLVADARDDLGRVARGLRARGASTVDIRVHVASSAGPVLADLARACDADLIAMTSHGRGASRLLMGSVADKVLRGTDCEVLLYRTQAAARSAAESTGYRAEDASHPVPA